MKTWPWTNVNKELEKRLKESENSESIKYDVDTLFKKIRERANNTPRIVKIWRRAERKLNDFVWNVYRYFNPCHKKIRDAIPRKWVNQVELIRDVNFAFIVEYVEGEMYIIDWESDDKHKEVAAFLDQAYTYIKTGRHLLEQKIWEALDEAILTRETEGIKRSYEERYGEHDQLEAELDQRDLEILVKLMQYRKWMWS